MKNISLKQRRFLIVWICINAFALFVNIAQFKGQIQEEYCKQVVGESRHIRLWPEMPPEDSIIARRKYLHPEIDLLTHGDGYEDTNKLAYFFSYNRGCGEKANLEHSFYPFRTKFLYSFIPVYSYFDQPGHNVELYGCDKPMTGFLGIFNGYSYLEFVVYTILGFFIIYIPKLWKGK